MSWLDLVHEISLIKSYGLSRYAVLTRLVGGINDINIYHQCTNYNDFDFYVD